MVRWIWQGGGGSRLKSGIYFLPIYMNNDVESWGQSAEFQQLFPDGWD